MDDIEISSGDLNNIPTESIASFSILKDASATAIYGARGANGVLLIKTKDGMENTRGTDKYHVRKFISKTGKHAEVRQWPYVYEYVQ